ncbi:MAG: GGDEF domain-containing protein [Lachnospiraceae bacterium]|nr:GGDEF domain-containing protein [Lachnospiraceae bacterium]
MDFSNLLEQLDTKSCVISVDTYDDGSYGNILVVTGNTLFKNDIEDLTKQPFVDNTPYYYSLPKDMNFEDFIYRSAVLHQPLHTYVNLSHMGLWVEMYLSPLKSDKPGTGYCLYSYVISPKANEEIMSDLSPDTSAKVLSACIKFRGSDDFIKTINEVAADIREICGAFRCCIATFDPANETSELLGDAFEPDSLRSFRSEKYRQDFYKLLLTFEDTLAGSTCVIVKNEQDMKVIEERNPEWYQSLKTYHVESMVLFPLRYRDSLLGYIWASNFDVNNTVKIKEILEITTFFIASEIANYQMLKKLERLGTIDILTGSLNRNAMNNRISRFDEEKDDAIKSIGVAFVDLNGLKMINDRDGHFAGDRSLKKSYALLKSVFTDDEIYRAGGDEFMVLCLNDPKEEFEAKIDRIREIIKEEKDVNFAIGSCYNDGDLDVRKALRIADELMYKDKNLFYEKHPELKYR